MNSRISRLQKDLLQEAARALGASVESVQTAPNFRRRLVRRRDESVVVDLVLDRTPRGEEPPRSYGAIVVDPPGEIFANKLCTLLSRAEIRDVVDVLALERAGLDLERGLGLATKKDAGMTPAQLAWVVSQIRIADDARIPGNFTVEEVRSFLDSLQRRLAALGFPPRDH